MPITPSILNDRTRAVADPLRNFKFGVQFINGTGNTVTAPTSVGQLGFTQVDGLNMSTEMIPYREGGMNTNPHKLPGMTDFSPVTFSTGVFSSKPGMWQLAKQMFAVQWGNGSLSAGQDYRYDVLIRVYDHPITKGPGSNVNGDVSQASVGFVLYNAWVASVSYSGLNAMDNAVLVQQMTLHHEGLDTLWESEIPGNI